MTEEQFSQLIELGTSFKDAVNWVGWGLFWIAISILCKDLDHHIKLERITTKVKANKGQSQ